MNLSLNISKSPTPYSGPLPPFVRPAFKTGGELMKSKVFRPRRSVGMRMYGAAQTSRLTADWASPQTSANAEVLVSYRAAKGRNRQLERDNDYFRTALRLIENNVIGHAAAGVKLQMKVREYAGLDELGNAKWKYDGQANAMIEAAWADYMKPENCTVMRNMSGGDVQRLAARRMGPDGAMMLRKHRGFDNKYKFAVEPLEIDMLNFYNMGRNEQTGNRIQFGIELDRYNAPVAYWILNRHPGEAFGPEAQPGKAWQERVPADEIIFVSGSIERAGQILPMPLWTSVAMRLNQLGRFEEAVQVASRVAACKGGFIVTKNIPSEYNGSVDDQGNPLEEIEPGLIQKLELGEEFQQFDPQFPMATSEGHIKAQLRGAAAGMNLSYINVANDLSETSYSSGRVGLLEVREEYKTLQTRIIDYLTHPWFSEWLTFAILSGQLNLPITKLAKFQADTWRPRRWPWVDPEKDVNANIKAVAARFTTREDVIEETGGDMEDVDAKFQADQTMKDLPVTPAYFANPPQEKPAEKPPAAG